MPLFVRGFRTDLIVSSPRKLRALQLYKMEWPQSHYVEYSWASASEPGEDQDDFQTGHEIDLRHSDNVDSAYIPQETGPTQAHYPTSPTGSTFSGSTLSPLIVVNGTPHSSVEIRVMADLLSQARQNSELPPPRYPNQDAISIVEDWNRLRSLREVRGDPALPPPDAYLKLRVRATQEIRERDARFEEAAEEEKGKQLVSSALAMVQDRGRLAEIVQSAVRGVDGEEGDETAGIDVQAVSEHIISIVEDTMLDSSSQLRANIDRMDDQIDALKSQVDVLTSAVNGQLGNLATAVSTLPSAVHRPPIHDALRHALRDVLAEAVRAMEYSSQTSRPPHHIPGLPPALFQDRLLMEPRRTPGVEVRRGLAHIANSGVRTRRIRGDRPRRLKEYVGRFFTRKETEDTTGSEDFSSLGI